MPIKPGDKAPDFTLLDQHGQPFSLSKSLKERKARHLAFVLPGAVDEPEGLARARRPPELLAVAPRGR